MTHQQRIEAHLTGRAGLCDDCLAADLKISHRQAVRAICVKSSTIHQSHGTCGVCKKDKIIRSVGVARDPVKTPPPRASKKRASASAFLREDDLRTKFNHSIATTLGIACENYYGRLGFVELLQLKSGYARIHDIITLKLTLDLVRWLGAKLGLSLEQELAMRAAVDSAHPNSAGFDLDSKDPNVIGEVKGNIPMNGLSQFGSAQLKGLTDDVRQMFGQPARHKEPDKVSRSSKIHRVQRAEALKFLGLYDSPQIRAATKSWMESFARFHPELKIKLAEGTRKFSPGTVYVVFLTMKPESVVSITKPAGK